MPTNTAITFSIVAGTVPPDRNCPKTGQEVANIVQDFCSINGATSSGDPVSPGDSVAEQALNTANTALAAVQELQVAQKAVRSSQPITLPTGDSNFAMPLIPPMPSTDYDVYATYFAGAAGFITAFYSFRVLESSISVNGCNLLFDNMPANTKVSIRVVER